MTQLKFAAAATTACALALSASAAQRPHPDHHEFDATVSAPYSGAAGEARNAQVEFSFPDAEGLLAAAWRIRVFDAGGAVVETLYGETALLGGAARQSLTWRAPRTGFYTLVLTARPMPIEVLVASSGESAQARVERFFAQGGEDLVETRTDVRAGTPQSPRLLPFRGMSSAQADSPAAAPSLRSGARRGSTAVTAAAGGFPYTVVLGNLHSQTNHSDGGGAVATCAGSETPWAGGYGPSDAFEMMRTQAGGDILLTSEHNHMYDGSTSTNGAADAAHAHALFNGGLQAAADYTAAHPGFLALYGTEWGVISNGGHLNILNPDGLATWESTSSGALFGDIFVPKSDYAAIYSTMKARGWVGMFNHPATSGQFRIGGVPFGYDPNGDEVMALSEVTNTSAFSKNVTETETFRTSYEAAFNLALEAGYHVAPTTDQDNHCANWGLSYPNRTGILLPEGTPLTKESFLAAVRARHVFATLDKRSQIVLASASGAIMGDRIANGGPLNLNVFWSTTGTHSVSRVQIFEGVPRRSGTTTQLADQVTSITLTPSPGAHYYYAVVTQDNGDKLWSAPIWIDQSAGPVAAKIVTPGADTTVANGATVDFTGSATTTNAAIVSMSWDFGDGSTASGASASHTYSNPGVSPVTRVASFTALDDQGAIGTASRSITVQPDASLNTPPSVSAIASMTLLKNTSKTVSFTIGDAQTPAALLDLTATSSDAQLFPAPNLVLGGIDAARTLTLTPAPNRTGFATITVTVADGAGATASSAFTASVSAGQAQLIISQYYEGVSNNKWIEITNVSDAAYDPAAGKLYLASWFNPATNGTTYTVDPINSVVLPGATILFKTSTAALPLAGNVTGTPTSFSSSSQFNGDDITYLTTVGTNNAASYDARVDVIGANLPAWTATSGSSTTGGQDRSYVRNRLVVSPSATYDPAQWTKLTLAMVDTAVTGTTQRLGEHVFNRGPSIGAVADQTIHSGEGLGPIAFTVGDAETAASALVVTASSSDETVIRADAIFFSGTGASRLLTATPVADQSGTTTITLTVRDGDGRASDSRFVVTVLPSVVTGVTVAPVSVYLHGGAQQQFTATVDGAGAASQEVLWTASGGTIDANGLYTPPLDGGPFTVTATSVQDSAFSGAATVTTNKPPVVADAFVETSEDTPVTVELTATDADGDALAFAITQPPNHGTVSGTPPSLTYTPAADFNGADGFSFIASDSYASPATGHVSINVAPVNDAPLAHDLATETDEDVPVALSLQASDVDSVALSYAIVATPPHGKLSGVAPSLTYIPDGDFNGTDTFTFAASDGQLQSNVATVRIVVHPVNDAPVAIAQVVGTAEDTPVNVVLSGTDVESDPLSFLVVIGPAHGTLLGPPPNVIYTPDADFNGEDAFMFVANDGKASSSPAWITIHVTPVNDAPIARNAAVTTDEDTPVRILLPASDPDGDPLSFAVVGLPAHGSLILQDGSVTYVPAPDFNGTDSFSFVASDGQLSSNPGSITIDVNPVNDAPVAVAQSVRTAEDTAVEIALAGSDADLDALSFRVVRLPAHGTLVGTAPRLVYTPEANWSGDDSFAFVANDGTVESAPATVRITVDPVDDAPVVSDLTVSTNEDVPVAVTLLASDVDNLTLSYTIVTAPQHGRLSGVAPALTYTPDHDWNGSDTFTWSASDGHLSSAVATVVIRVGAVNDAPVANDASVTTRKNFPAYVRLSATDAEGDALTYRIVKRPAHGTLIGFGRDYLYLPYPGFTGADAFSFVANDGKTDSAAAQVTITVLKPPTRIADRDD